MLTSVAKWKDYALPWEIIFYEHMSQAAHTADKQWIASRYSDVTAASQYRAAVNAANKLVAIWKERKDRVSTIRKLAQW